MLRKYIIIKGRPVLFPNDIMHVDVLGKDEGIESAGFFTVTTNCKEQKLKIKCFGESTTLSISSRPEIDQQIIACFLKLEQ